MSTPETGSGGGRSVPETKTQKASPVAEVATALTEFLGEFKSFQDDLHSRVQKQEERLTMLQKKTISAGRPALSAAAEGVAPHAKAFNAYLRNGDDDGLRGLELEGKGLSTAVAGDGGYLVDPQTADTIKTVLSSTASLRAIANVATVEATSFDVLIDRADMGAGWASETGASVETDTPQIERISIPLHELSALPKASQRLLDDSAFDIDGWLADRIAKKFARAEAAAFINGNGSDKPTGILDHTIVAEGSQTWGELGYIATGVDGEIGDADALVDVVYALGAEYRANATFVMNSKTAGTIRKLKDADGRFMWSDGLAAGEPARLLGYPVLIAEDMPDIATGAHAIAFGDFHAGYTIAERPDLRVLRDPFSAKPHVLFYATKRVGGDVSDFEAIKLLKFSAS
ncbi:phage major capsid protein [Vannielia litorea]|uniref:Phage major capsid protein, HK97 family n=1 Tax=Vannielia litorea TaxID=1217970 RepID=A0A1N6F1N4_9RHOB|nr:phage major capsid protein [Vannielia litorea]SIN89127.1 phage major capsid protein, HK97 family [Vannielia litorea]